MNTQLTFKSHIPEAIEHDGKFWFTAATLAKALEYSRGDHVTRIYNRNADEFSPCMTCIVENVKLTLPVKSTSYRNIRTKTRVFSMRSAHLIAMFASTPVAKGFRKWILDLLEREESPVQQQSFEPDETT